VHLVTLAKWKRHFLEHGAEAYERKEVKPYKKRMAELERMLRQMVFCWATALTREIPVDWDRALLPACVPPICSSLQ